MTYLRPLPFLLLLLLAGCLTTPSESGVNTTALEERLSALEERIAALESAQAPITLEGDVVGSPDNTSLAEGSVGSREIAEGSIGREHVKADEIQLRIDEGCPAGSFITTVAENGSVACGRPNISFSTPPLSAVLEAGGDAAGKSIEGLNSLEVERLTASRGQVEALAAEEASVERLEADAVEAEEARLDELCLSGDCRGAWPTFNTSININRKFYVMADNMGSERRYHIAEAWDICSLAGMWVRANYHSHCWLETDVTGWYVRVGAYARCKVICLNLTLQ